MKRIFLAFAFLLASCAGEFDSQTGLNDIASQSEFVTPLYAQLHLGREILTGDNHTSPDAYIKAKYAVLLDAGLINYTIKEKNSWRTLVELSLTDAATTMTDKARTAQFQAESGENDIFYVAVCNLRPQTVLSVDTVAKDTMRLCYQIAERDITPFGRYLDFEDGRTHNHSRNFVKSTFSWALTPVE